MPDPKKKLKRAAKNAMLEGAAEAAAGLSSMSRPQAGRDIPLPETKLPMYTGAIVGAGLMKRKAK